MALVPVLPPLEGESLFSWCARLAGFHSGLPCEDFLKMLQISRQSVMQHSEECVERLSDLTGLPSSDIRDCGIQRLGDRRFCFRHEEFAMYFALRTHTSYCPACLLEDRAPNGASAGCRVGLTSWMFGPIRTCPRHGIAIFRRPNVGYHEGFQDMNRVAPCDLELERQAREADQRKVSPLQHYVEGRFCKVRAGGWLDHQRIDQAAKSCEMLGACLVFGAHTDLDKLSFAQWDEAGAAGFEAARDGEHGIRQAFERIEMRSKKERQFGGPQAAFGRLYQWIQFNKTKSDPGPIRDVLRSHILDSMAIEPGTILFGETVDHRRRHSVTSLARESGVHVKTLNRTLVRAGVIPGSESTGSRDQTTFDAALGEKLARRINESIPITKIPEFLNCNRRQAELLVRHGLVSRIVPNLDGRGGVLKNVALEDLREFLSRFRAAGRPVSEAGEGMVDVITASEKSRQTTIDIVRFVIEGRLRKVEVLNEELRFRSVLVDPEEVRAEAAVSTSDGELGTGEVANRIGTLNSAVVALRETEEANGRPFLPAIEERNLNGKIRHRFREADVNEFAAKYVSLGKLAKERGKTRETIGRLLKDQGIQPILSEDVLGAKIFRRADL